jgi:hypothetical protein
MNPGYDRRVEGSDSNKRKAVAWETGAFFKASDNAAAWDGRRVDFLRHGDRCPMATKDAPNHACDWGRHLKRHWRTVDRVIPCQVASPQSLMINDNNFSPLTTITFPH